MNNQEKAFKQQNIREHNIELIMNLLYGKSMSCIELSNAINISDVGANKIVKELLSLKLIIKDDSNEYIRKKGGQHIRYKINPNFGLYICIDYTHEADKVIFYDFACNKLKTIPLDVPIVNVNEEDINETINIIKEYSDSILDNYSNNIVSIAIAVPGQVNSRNEFLFSGKFYNFQKGKLARMFEKAFNAPLIIKNNVHYMALGEYYKNSLNSPYNIETYIYLGYGIASCVLLNGKVVTGWEGYAGEIGGDVLKDGTTLSMTCSLYRIIAKAEKIIGPCDFERLLKVYKTNSEIHSIVIEAAKNIGYFIVNSSNLIGCNTFMLSGLSLQFGDEFINTIEEVVSRKSVNYSHIIKSNSDESVFYGMIKTIKDDAVLRVYRKGINELNISENIESLDINDVCAK